VNDVARQNISALRAGHDELLDIVGGMSEVDLGARSAAAEWDMSQVISHLGSGAVISSKIIDDAVAGQSAFDGSFNRGVWDRWDAMSTVERRDEFLVVAHESMAKYEALTAEQLDSLTTNLGFMPTPVGMDFATRIRLNEFTLHSWDIRVMADPSAQLRAEAVPCLLEHTAFAMGWYAKPAVLAGVEKTVVFHLNDPKRDVIVHFGGHGAVVESADFIDAEAFLSGEAFLRLTTGRLPAAHTPADVRVEGDVSLDTLRAIFPGF